jgi:ATP-dependent protease Clp ATPase subunit
MEAQRTGKVTRKKINTKNILFIVSGAFSGLEEIIQKGLICKALALTKRERVSLPLRIFLKISKLRI